MMYLMDAVSYQESVYAPEGLTCGGQDSESSKEEISCSVLLQSPRLESEEVLAAYVARERHVPSMLRLMLEMNEDQRRLSLAVLQCVSAGNFTSLPKVG